MPKKFSETVEEWRPISGYKDWYEISNFGRVKSLPRYFKHKNSKVWYPGGMLVSNTGHQYLYVFLSKNGIRKKFYIHTLVLKTFKRCRLVTDKRLCCNHRDGNKLNNHANNLEWSNYSLNGLHAYATGLKKVVTPPSAWGAGESHPNSKFSNLERLKICEDAKTIKTTRKAYAASLGITYNGLKRILDREQVWRELLNKTIKDE
jgi:hypothetical protein